MRSKKLKVLLWPSFLPSLVFLLFPILFQCVCYLFRCRGAPPQVGHPWRPKNGIHQWLINQGSIKDELSNIKLEYTQTYWEHFNRKKRRNYSLGILHWEGLLASARNRTFLLFLCILWETVIIQRVSKEEAWPRENIYSATYAEQRWWLGSNCGKFHEQRK